MLMWILPLMTTFDPKYMYMGHALTQIIIRIYFSWELVILLDESLRIALWAKKIK